MSERFQSILVDMKNTSLIPRSWCVFKQWVPILALAYLAAWSMTSRAALSSAQQKACQQKAPTGGSPKVSSCILQSCRIQTDSQNFLNENKTAKDASTATAQQQVGNGATINDGARALSSESARGFNIDVNTLADLNVLPEACRKSCDPTSLSQQEKRQFPNASQQIQQEQQACLEKVNRDIAEVEAEKNNNKQAKDESDKTDQQSGQSPPPGSQPQQDQAQTQQPTPPQQAPPQSPQSEEGKKEDEAKAEFASCANMTGAAKATCEQKEKDAQLASTCNQPTKAGSSDCQAYKNRICGQDPSGAACQSLQSANICASGPPSNDATMIRTYCTACGDSAKASSVCKSNFTGTAQAQSLAAGAANFGGGSSSGFGTASVNGNQQEIDAAALKSKLKGLKDQMGAMAAEGGGVGGSGGSGSGSSYSYQSSARRLPGSASGSPLGSSIGGATLPGNTEVSSQSVFDLLSVPSEVIGRRCQNGLMLHCE